MMFLRKFRANLSKIYSANADDIEKVSPNFEESKNKNYKFVQLMFNLWHFILFLFVLGFFAKVEALWN